MTATPSTALRDLTVPTWAAVVGMIAPLVVDLIAPNALERPKSAAFFALIAVGIVELVAMFTWTFLVVKNAHALRPREQLRFTPWTALGWYIIPFANFYMPYRALAEAWRASNPTTLDDASDKWRASSGPIELLVWWVLSIVAIIGMSPEPIWKWIGTGVSVVAIAAFVKGALAMKARQAQCASARSA